MTEKLDEVQKLIDEILQICADGKYIFRGTTEIYSNKRKGISSSVYRWAIEQKVKFHSTFYPMDIEKEIVKKAKRLFPPHTSEIEILTDLRHYGGKVALIDFSRSLYVALFFACNGAFKEPGEVVMLKTDDFKTINDIDYKKKEQDIRIINPAPTDPSRARVLAQKSVFVVAPDGYIAKDKCETFRIEAKHKKKIIEHLKSFHNIDIDTIYNDLIGFIANEENYTTAEGKRYKDSQKKKPPPPKRAIDYYTKAIALNPKFAKLYYNRGTAKLKLVEYKKAIKDYDEAIELKPKDALAYYNRGNVKLALGKYEEAIKDYDKTIALNPEYAEPITTAALQNQLRGI